MPDNPDASTISVAQTLALLDGPFLSVANDVAESRNAFLFVSLKNLADPLLREISQ